MKKNAGCIKKDMIQWLEGGGLNFSRQEDAIGNEVLFAPMMRRADLLILSKKETHVLEIKSELDSTALLEGQLQDYLQTFDRVSVVTVPRNIDQVRTILPARVGLILVEDTRISVIRTAKKVKKLNKVFLAYFLNKSNLAKITGLKGISRMETGEVRKLVVNKCSVSQLRQAVYDLLYSRYRPLFQEFLVETSNYSYSEDELKMLCWHVSSPFRGS